MCEGVSAGTESSSGCMGMAASSGERSNHKLVLSVGECGESGVFPCVFLGYNRKKL